MPGTLRTRYVKDRYIKRRADGSLWVKSKAFQPRRVQGGQRELSTVGIDGMAADDVWTIGYEHYLPSGRRLRGRADVKSSVFFEWGLTYVSQPVPTPTHGSFVGSSEDEEDRLEVMSELADRAEPHLHPLGSDSPVKR